MRIEDLKQKLYQDILSVSPENRRALLIREMQSLKDKQIHCIHCPGTCCTMSANSMQITPLEAFDILLSLNLDDETKEEQLKEKLRDNIRHYRLDHEIFLGKKAHTHLRKTYTCPFFIPGPKGCTIKKELKPYGCLGFNPRLENDNGSSCQSDQKLLEDREDEHQLSEDLANAFLRSHFQLTWTKLEIPKAVLALLEAVQSSRHL